MSGGQVFPAGGSVSQNGGVVTWPGSEPPTHILTIVYLTDGTTPSCCEYPVPPQPGFDYEFINCAAANVPGSGETNIVNGNASCPCTGPVGTEQSSWGKIKALHGGKSKELDKNP